jgi:hypothetical protein
MFLEEMKPVALARIKGGLLRRIFRPRPIVVVSRHGTVGTAMHRDDGLKFSRASYFSAIHAAGERMAPNERSAWLEDGTLPDGFWEWVEREAASWDALPG